MVDKVKSGEGLKPYPNDSEGLSPTVKTVDPDHPADDRKPRGKARKGASGAV